MVLGVLLNFELRKKKKRGRHYRFWYIFSLMSSFLFVFPLIKILLFHISSSLQRVLGLHRKVCNNIFFPPRSSSWSSSFLHLQILGRLFAYPVFVSFVITGSFNSIYSLCVISWWFLFYFIFTFIFCVERVWWFQLSLCIYYCVKVEREIE